MKWIMVANSNDCRIYEYDQHIEKLNLIDEIKHPENRLKNHDLDTDRPGHYQSPGFARGAYEPEKTTHDHAVENFAREMALKLNAGRNKHAYESLVLLMPPAIEGLLLKHLKKQILCMVQQIIQKNMVHLSEHELKQYLCRAIRGHHALH